VLSRRCLEPHSEAVVQEQLIGLRLRNDAASDAQHDVVLVCDDTLQASALQIAIARLTVEHEDFGKRHAGFALDLAIELDELPAHSFCQCAPERGLSGTTQTDERDSHPADALIGAELRSEPSQDIPQTVLRQGVDKAVHPRTLDTQIATEQVGDPYIQ